MTHNHANCAPFRVSGHPDPEPGTVYGDLYGKPQPVMCTSAWIDPLGKFYPVEDCGHEMFAHRHFDSYASDLERKGWVHLSFGALIFDRIRQAQIDTLYDVVEHYVDGGYRYAEDLRRALYDAIESME